MFRSSLRFLAAIPLAWVLYFFGLTRTGLISTDEPRYASIAREMARSGDWITPRLWGQPWFEKPALLYWMEGAAFRLGVNQDLAPRLPIALMSVAFLIFFYWILRREFGDLVAGYATAILATSAAWLGFSHIGVTDLPLAATFSAAMLVSLGSRAESAAGCRSPPRCLVLLCWPRGWCLWCLPCRSPAWDADGSWTGSAPP